MSFSRFQHSLLQVSRRTTHSATLERYGLIRNFFLRQVRTSASPLNTPPTLSIAVNRSHAVGQKLLYAHRLFHATFRLQEEDKSQRPNGPEKPPDPAKDVTKDGQATDQRYLENYSKFFRQLALSLPHLSRPTRDDFLNAATGFWSRMRVRFKWLTIRSFRRYNADDISAFITWFVMSQTVWLLVGTTTFFSVVFATINSLRLQEYVAKAISDYLTSETGITIVFESAIVPKWKDSRISFKNVFVTCRPRSVPSIRPLNTTAHDVALGYDISNHPAIYGLIDEEEPLPEIVTDEDINYTMFDLTIDSIDVTLSLARWLDGKGVVTDAVVKGVRGVLDRRYVYWDPENPWDPAAFRHKGQSGDFELESLQLEDVLVTVYQPGGFRPYTASIFRADMKTFRKQWMFYDFLSADNVVGQFDNCLFSLHKPQSIGRTTRQEQDNKDRQWSRMTRFRIDGVNIDHIQQMTTSEGPISWITSGKLDAVLDIQFPRDASDDDTALTVLIDAIDAIAERIPGQKQLAKPPLSAPSDKDEPKNDEKPKVVVDIDLRFRDLKAAVPIFTYDLSYTNNALIRPIVAFMNANRTLIPIHCKVVKDLNEFDGAWTMWETGLMDVIGDKVYEAMAYHVTQANFNRRIKAVSAWSLQRTAQAVLAALKTMTNPVTEQLRELYDDPGIYQWQAWFPGVGGIGIAVGAD
ncbi:mitochondrial distribution and morphology proteins-domain-containing protein [Irpex rosettiformis]|uniref:Mitochondrial distribution and morphology proteins-domain-containing protein n=1 Tax=Irpex rosettiformis TaxID=378272 RepID=A0ACB8TT95_9APHY|nr:mitochondrial distribution and morphology proteins-domain-containing protein [Irpex rosettiformis]